MALPWSILGSARLQGGNLVEDMQWGIDLAVAGHLPLFFPEAKVTARCRKPMPSAASGPAGTKDTCGRPPDRRRAC